MRDLMQLQAITRILGFRQQTGFGKCKRGHWDSQLSQISSNEQQLD